MSKENKVDKEDSNPLDCVNKDKFETSLDKEWVKETVERTNLISWRELYTHNLSL